MPKVVKRTFSLTEEQAAFIDRKVESGGCRAAILPTWRAAG